MKYRRVGRFKIFDWDPLLKQLNPTEGPLTALMRTVHGSKSDWLGDELFVISDTAKRLDAVGGTD